MELKHISVLLPGLLLTALFCGGASAEDYSKLSAGIARAASASGVSCVSVGAFSAVPGAEEEARYAAEATYAGLATAGLRVLDQETLEAHVPDGGGWLTALPEKQRPQAILKGAIFRDEAGYKLMVRLVHTASGRVLGVGSLRAETISSEVPAVPKMDWNTPPLEAPVPSDLRDAPTGDPGPDCGKAFAQLGRINSKILDLKARYWAAKMRAPGFTYASLIRNPGSEIRDTGERQKFYQLLARYHDAKESPGIESHQSVKLEAFMNKEAEVINHCGLK